VLPVRLPNHGGLTPAAPADVRLCIAQIAISPADIRTPTQERGASAPRGLATATAPEFVIAPLTDSRDFAEAYWQVRFPNHGGLTRGAPVERAFVHRECRYSSADRCHAPRAAGVSQPWCTIRSCVLNVITPRKPIAIAGVVTEPRRADTRRSCERAFVHPECRYFSADRLRAPGAADVIQPWL
jgi:hypothetical protein